MEHHLSALLSRDAANDTTLQTAFRVLLEHTQSMVFIKNTDSVYLAASAPFLRMAGKSSLEEILGKTDFEIFEDQTLAKRYVDDDRKLLAGQQDLVGYIEPLTDQHGHPRYSSTSKYILRNDAGQSIGILGISRDITREYMTRQRHQKELKYLFSLPDNTHSAVFTDIEDWRIIHHHRSAAGNEIIPLYENMEDFKNTILSHLADPEDHASRTFFETLSRETMLERSASGARHFALEYLRKLPNGENIWVRVDVNFLIDPESSHLCCIWSLRDIHSTKQETMELLQAAERDEMTGLFNRASTTKQIQRILEENADGRHALFMLDIDNFKALNDTHGHQAGDDFLITLAKTLKSCFRDSDIVGRIGGDEFFVLMKNVPGILTVAEKAETLLRIIQALCEKYGELNLSASIGISMFPEDGNTLDILYRQSDSALYQAKHQGKNRYIFSDASLSASQIYT